MLACVKVYILRKFVAPVYIFHFNRNYTDTVIFVQDNVRLDLLYQTWYDFVMVPYLEYCVFQIFNE